MDNFAAVKRVAEIRDWLAASVGPGSDLSQESVVGLGQPRWYVDGRRGDQARPMPGTRCCGQVGLGMDDLSLVTVPRVEQVQLLAGVGAGHVPRNARNSW